MKDNDDEYNYAGEKTKLLSFLWNGDWIGDGITSEKVVDWIINVETKRLNSKQ